mgnify:FL=1
MKQKLLQKIVPSDSEDDDTTHLSDFDPEKDVDLKEDI